MKIPPFIFFVFLFVLTTTSVIAQGGPPPPDGGGGPGTVDDVPINFLIYPFLIIATYFGVRFFSSKS